MKFGAIWMMQMTMDGGAASMNRDKMGERKRITIFILVSSADALNIFHMSLIQPLSTAFRSLGATITI